MPLQARPASSLGVRSVLRGVIWVCREPTPACSHSTVYKHVGDPWGTLQPLMPADATCDVRGGTQGLDRRCRLRLTSTPAAPWPNPACPFVDHCSTPGSPTLSKGCSLAVCLGFPVCKEGMMTASLLLHPPYRRSGPRNSPCSSTPYPQCSYYSHGHQTGCQDHGRRVLERPCQHSALLFQVPGPAQPPASSPCPGLGPWTLDLTAVVRGVTRSLIPSTKAPAHEPAAGRTPAMGLLPGSRRFSFGTSARAGGLLGTPR